MIQVTPHIRIYVAGGPTDFRRGIDGMCRACRDQMQADPFCGAMFVFINRRKTSLKILTYDGQGFWLCQKRLSRSRFRFWPCWGCEKSHRLTAQELQILLWNGDPEASRIQEMWREVRGEERI